jgi:hypothetical protein
MAGRLLLKLNNLCGVPATDTSSSNAFLESPSRFSTPEERMLMSQIGVLIPFTCKRCTCNKRHSLEQKMISIQTLELSVFHSASLFEGFICPICLTGWIESSTQIRLFITNDFWNTFCADLGVVIRTLIMLCAGQGSPRTWLKYAVSISPNIENIFVARPNLCWSVFHKTSRSTLLIPVLRQNQRLT